MNGGDKKFIGSSSGRSCSNSKIDIFSCKYKCGGGAEPEVLLSDYNLDDSFKKELPRCTSSVEMDSKDLKEDSESYFQTLSHTSELSGPSSNLSKLSSAA